MDGEQKSSAVTVLAGHLLGLICTGRGGNPHPTLTIVRLLDGQDQQQVAVGKARDVRNAYKFRAAPSDNGVSFRCLASNADAADAVASDVLVVHVHCESGGGGVGVPGRVQAALTKKLLLMCWDTLLRWWSASCMFAVEVACLVTNVLTSLVDGTH